jgi:peptidoglycan-N-acetylglucosamine deacetylase
MATVTLAWIVLLLPAVAPAAAPVDPAHQPLVVRATSLVQDGQQLVWSVRLTTSFSPSAMRAEGRTLCLVIRRANASVSGVLCVAPPPPRTHAPVLVYQPVTVHGRGPGRIITATVTRSATDQLAGRFLPAQIQVPYAPMRWQVLTTLVAAKCEVTPRAHAAGGGCATYFPVSPPLLRLHVPQLVRCVASGSSFVSSGPRNRRAIALTFDDGPWYDTPEFLRILERKHVPATFFQIGRQIGQYGPGVDRRMLADGDIIGDHTWNHADVAAGGAFAAHEITSTAAAIRRLTGFQPCLFRAPGGAVGPSLISGARRLGFLTIQWNIDPRDWAMPGSGAILANVLANARNGAIIIQHDGGGNRSQTLAALPAEIDRLRARGFNLVTVPQLLGLRLIYK